MSHDTQLKKILLVLDDFFEQTSTMLGTLKGILETDYGYSVIGDSAVTRRNSASLNFPRRWAPMYLSYSFSKEDGNKSILLWLFR